MVVVPESLLKEGQHGPAGVTAAGILSITGKWGDFFHGPILKTPQAQILMNRAKRHPKAGSEEHKNLFCRFFLDSHHPYRPEDIVWPELSKEELQRLKGLPVWDQAVKTETNTALKVQTLGQTERDPLLREAIALQGFEEGRHARVLELMTSHYGIEVAPFKAPRPPANPTWAFMRTGYGECMDSFFAFGLFQIGKSSNFFPPALIDIFDPVMQEEARHILFLVNWAAFLSARTSLPLKPVFEFRRMRCILSQAIHHLKLALQKDSSSQEAFPMKSKSAFGDFTLRSFLELCLAENSRRLSLYDPRLRQPGLVPKTARVALMFIPKKKAAP